jgi:hypothetical protein
MLFSKDMVSTRKYEEWYANLKRCFGQPVARNIYVSNSMKKLKGYSQIKTKSCIEYTLHYTLTIFSSCLGHTKLLIIGQWTTD